MARKRSRPGLITRLRNGVSHNQLKRLTPAQNVKAGYSPKARHYVLLKPDGSVPRITKRTPTISANQYEKLRTGLPKAQATKARLSGELPYKSARAEQTAAKIRRTTESKRGGRDFPAYFLDRVRADARNKTTIFKGGGPTKGSKSLVVHYDSAVRALENRAKRLRGEHIPDGEWHAMVDYMAHYEDPYVEILRGSPNVKGSRIG